MNYLLMSSNFLPSKTESGIENRVYDTDCNRELGILLTHSFVKFLGSCPADKKHFTNI